MEKKKQSMVRTLLMSRLLHVLHRTVRFLCLSCLASEGMCSNLSSFVFDEEDVNNIHAFLYRGSEFWIHN